MLQNVRWHQFCQVSPSVICCSLRSCHTVCQQRQVVKSIRCWCHILCWSATHPAQNKHFFLWWNNHTNLHRYYKHLGVKFWIVMHMLQNIRWHQLCQVSPSVVCCSLHSSLFRGGGVFSFSKGTSSSLSLSSSFSTVSRTTTKLFPNK